MLKTISSITNALGALNYKGTWNASTNTPTLADGTGAKGDYYVVSTAGTQTFGGVQLFFGLGDWIAYNGAVWQRVEGGSDGNFANVTLTSTDAGATAAPLLDLYRDSATPAASDTLGEIEFNGEDSAGNKQAYALFHGSILSPTSGAEQGQLHFETATAGALTEKMIIGTTNLVINEIGAVFNVRIEGDTDANLFYTDATNDRVGVGILAPTEKLDVVGNIKTSSNLGVGTALSAWGGNYRALQAGSTAVFAGNTAANRNYSSSNVYWNGSSYRYITTSFATQLEQSDGAFYWLQAASGTAGNAITFATGMSLDTSSNLSVTGNVVMSTSGKGIDFSVTSQAGGMTSELLADYEEGTWTPALLFDNAMAGSFTYTTQTGTYTKIGRLVTARFTLAWTARPSGGTIMVLNIPFTAVNAANVRGFISDQGGITNTGTYAITGGDGLVISSYVSTQCSIATVKSGAAYADPLQQTALTAAAGQLRGEISYEVS